MKHYKDLDEITENEIDFTRNDVFDDIEEIEIAGYYFVLTGTFTSGKRKDIENLINQQGGKVLQKKVTKSTDYLVVGEVTSRDWKYGNYGTKIEKALEIRDDSNLKIIPEQVLMKSLKQDSEAPHKIYIDELFDIFLKIPSINSYKIVDFNTGEIETCYLDSEIDNYQEFIFSKLKGKAIDSIFHISLIKHAFNKLTDQEKKEIEKVLKDKLENYLKTSLTLHFKDIKNKISSVKRQSTKLKRLDDGIQNLIDDFGPFSESKFCEKQINKFKTNMLDEIEKE
jgi:hypothetical protein